MKLATDWLGRPLDCTHQEMQLGMVKLKFSGIVSFDNHGAAIPVSVDRLTPKGVLVRLASGNSHWLPRQALKIDEAGSTLSMALWCRIADWPEIANAMMAAHTKKLEQEVRLAA